MQLQRRLEEEHLSATLSLIEEELAAMLKKRAELTEIVYRLEMMGTYDNELMVQGFILSRTRLEVTGLSLARDVPYFSRVDFLPREGEEQTHYIGKHGVMDSNTMNSIVVDWRSPIANLYYAGQIGQAHYETPDGVVDGELTRKRMFDIREGKLHSFMDVDVVAQDQYLVDALSAVSSDRLKEVVTTIQAEQNAIIRHPMRVPLIVQGVAGSGKTTIALHRIAYLLYRHADTLLAQNLMILAPNPLFLQYISSVLPDLGVENARQTTFSLLGRDLLGKLAPKAKPGEPLDALLDDPEKAERLRRICRRKGSLAFGEALADYLAQLESRIAPGEDIRFGPALLLSAEHMRTSFQVDLAPFPWRRRQQEIAKVLKKKAMAAAADLKRAMQELCVQRADRIRASLPDTAERRERLTALYQSRDDRLAEIDERHAQFQKGIKHLFPALDPYAIYADFLLAQGGELSQDIDDIRKRKTAAEDLPAILIIERTLGGLTEKPSVQHIIIDEAQDFSPLSLKLLCDLFSAPLTLVGDMGQGIYRYRGMDSWDEAAQAIPGAQLRLLETSYRSTMEIMQYANSLAEKYPYPGQILAKPVLRHGSAPAILHCADAREQEKAVANIIQSHIENGLHSIAVIARDTKSADAWYKRLAAQNVDCRRLLPETDDYKGGVLVTSATSVKGLEFDAVIVPDAASYPQDVTGARLLYVCATRALHELAVLSA